MVETIRDSLLMSILSPTRRSVKNFVFVPLTEDDVAVTLAVPTIRVFAIAIVTTPPLLLTASTVAAAACPYVPGGFTPNITSSPTAYPEPGLLILILPIDLKLFGERKTPSEP